MPVVTFVEHNGESHAIEAESGLTLMENAINNAIQGIDADCGGASACGTCHCYVADDWLEKTGDVAPIEESMLAIRPDREEGSRLSCQINVSDAMDGLVVRLPEYQM